MSARAIDMAAECVRELAKTSNGASMALTRSAGHSRPAAAAAIKQLTATGAIIMAQAGGVTRYFAHARDALAHAEKSRPQPYMPVTRLTDCRPREQGVISHRAARTVTIYPGWTHDPRTQCGPDETVAGAGFVAAGIGRYLDAAP